MVRYRLGTRGSAQTHRAQPAIAATRGWAADKIAVVMIRATGDRVQAGVPAEIGGKAWWTKDRGGALAADLLARAPAARRALFAE